MRWLRHGPPIFWNTDHAPSLFLTNTTISSNPDYTTTFLTWTTTILTQCFETKAILLQQRLYHFWLTDSDYDYVQPRLFWKGERFSSHDDSGSRNAASHQSSVLYSVYTYTTSIHNNSQFEDDFFYFATRKSSSVPTFLTKTNSNSPSPMNSSSRTYHGWTFDLCVVYSSFCKTSNTEG